MWKKKAVKELPYIETILEELGKTTENMEQNRRPPSRTSGFIPAKYEAAGLPTFRRLSENTV
jgi:hypothetical protein